MTVTGINLLLLSVGFLAAFIFGLFGALSFETVVALWFVCISIGFFFLNEKNFIAFALSRTMGLSLIITVLYPAITLLTLVSVSDIFSSKYSAYYILSVTQINSALVFLSVAILSAKIGIYFGGKGIQNKGHSNFSYHRLMKPLDKGNKNFSGRRKVSVLYVLATKKIYAFIFLFCFSLIYFVLTGSLGWEMKGGGWQLGWIVRIIVPNFFLQLMILSWIRYQPEMKGSVKLLVIISVAILFASSIYQGSRGIALSLVLYLAFGWIIGKGNERIKLPILISLGIVLFVFSSFIWLASTESRLNSRGLSSSQSTGDEFVSVTARLGAGLNNFLIAYSKDPDPFYLQDLRSTERIVSSIVNSLVPGRIFGDQGVGASGSMFRGVFYSGNTTGTHGDEWSWFGFFYVLFGPLYSLFFIFLFGLIVARFLRYASDSEILDNDEKTILVYFIAFIFSFVFLTGGTFHKFFTFTFLVVVKIFLFTFILRVVESARHKRRVYVNPPVKRSSVY